MINLTSAPTHGASNSPGLPAHTAATRTNGSIYDAPSLYSPGENGIRTKSEPLYSDGYTTINRQATWDVYEEPPYLKRVSLLVQTGNAADTVHVSKSADERLILQINGRSHSFEARDKYERPVDLHIKTQGGNDDVRISPDVNNKVTIEGGEGNDTLRAGSGRTRLLGGAGNDTLTLGSNSGYAEGNDGDDTIMGGTGNAVMYGNNGNDRLYAAAGPAGKQSYLDGGSGSDLLHAGNGHTILHGGKGDDHLVGHDRTTFYSGRGQDHISNNQRGDLIYAKDNDTYDRSQNSVFRRVEPTEDGDAGFKVSTLSSPEFKQRVEDDFEFLRSSPNGRKILADMDKQASLAGGKIAIREETQKGSSYLFGSTELDKARQDGIRNIERDDPRRGRITDNKPGSLADKGVVAYNRTDIEDPSGRTFDPPIVGLTHETGHAYNGATGTNLPGTTREQSPSDPNYSSAINNTEFQVVGLPSSAPPFHFNGPSNPATNVNPEHFTENGMRRELGLPERTSYLT